MVRNQKPLESQSTEFILGIQKDEAGVTIFLSAIWRECQANSDSVIFFHRVSLLPKKDTIFLLRVNGGAKL